MLFPLKKVSKSNHKYERINQMAAGIILARYGDTLSSWYGEFTRMDRSKFTSLKFPSVFIKMADSGRRTVSSAHKELWSGWPELDPKTQTNNYLPSKKVRESNYFIVSPSNSLKTFLTGVISWAVITLQLHVTWLALSIVFTTQPLCHHIPSSLQPENIN